MARAASRAFYEIRVNLRGGISPSILHRFERILYGVDGKDEGKGPVVFILRSEIFVKTRYFRSSGTDFSMDNGFTTSRFEYLTLLYVPEGPVKLSTSNAKCCVFVLCTPHLGVAEANVFCS